MKYFHIHTFSYLQELFLLKAEYRAPPQQKAEKKIVPGEVKKCHEQFLLVLVFSFNTDLSWVTRNHVKILISSSFMIS